MAKYLISDTILKKVADAIRVKGGTTAPLVFPDGFSAAVGAIQTGGGTVTVTGPAITFIDYDGTLVTKWAIADLADKTELPTPPSHDGLTFQEWNWTLEDIKALTQEMVVGALYVTDDGKTRLYIHLEDGRTSPMLGCCPNGTVTVDWGDGTTPDTLTGISTSTVKWTPTHAYAAAGDYVVTLQVEGAVGFADSPNGSCLLRYSSGSNARNRVYQNAIQKVEIGSGVTSIGNNAFQSCYSLASITIPDGVTSIGAFAFDACYGMKYYDFTALTAVPASANANAFNGIAADCEIRVPASLVDEWKAAANWATYADYIVGV